MLGKISIIMTTKNNSQTLPVTMQSVLQQTYSNFELIIISDQSTDGTVEYIESLVPGDNRIIHEINSEYLGGAKSTMKGLALATGEFIYFIDADDFIQCTNLELLISNIEDRAFVGGLLEYVNADNFPEKLEHASKISETLPDLKIKELNKTRQTQGFSPLGVLFKNSFIQRNQSLILENLDYYYRGLIIHKMLCEGKQPALVEAVYYKRSRKKVITAPSLSQQYPIRTRMEFYEMLSYLLNQEDTTTGVRKQYVAWIMIYFKNKILPLTDYEINNELADFKKMMALFTKLIQEHKQEINQENLTFFQKKQFKSMLNNSVEGYLKNKNKAIKVKQIKSLKHDFKKKRGTFNFTVYELVFKHLPKKKNLIFFEAFYGKGVTDSPKYIYEHILEQYGSQYKMVWSFADQSKLETVPNAVLRGSLKYYYTIARASFWVNNTRMPVSLRKDAKVNYLQTWHGTPLKRLFLDLTGVIEPNERVIVRQSERWDYLVSANKFSSEKLSSAFGYQGDILEMGYPRNDKLYSGNNEKNIINLKETFGIPLDKKVILYAPTWRDDTAGEGSHFDLFLDIENLRNSLSDDYVLILRLHYHVSESIVISEDDTFVYNLSEYDDVGDIALVSDMLITDYSSIFFDYAHLKKPMIFFMYDAAHYFNNLRGTYINNLDDILPGPIVKANNELLTEILRVEENKMLFHDKYEHFHKEYCAFGRGDSTEKITHKLLNNK